MVKILTGNSGQADAVPGSPWVMPWRPANSWYIVSSPFMGGGPEPAHIASHTSPNQWMVTQTGTITVPPSAALGLYYALFQGESVGEGMSGTNWYYYEFEVVCMKVTLRSYTRALP